MEEQHSSKNKYSNLAAKTWGKQAFDLMYWDLHGIHTTMLHTLIAFKFYSNKQIQLHQTIIMQNPTHILFVHLEISFHHCAFYTLGNDDAMSIEQPTSRLQVQFSNHQAMATHDLQYSDIIKLVFYNRLEILSTCISTLLHTVLNYAAYNMLCSVMPVHTSQDHTCPLGHFCLDCFSNV